MSTTIIVLIVLSAGTYALKSAGPLLLGGRRLPGILDRMAERIPAALLAALVVVATFGDGRALTIDARAAGVLAAGVALWRRAPFVVVVIVAIGVTAVFRAVVGG